MTADLALLLGQKELGIAQKGNKALLEAIVVFLQNLASQHGLVNYGNDESVGLYLA